MPDFTTKPSAFDLLIDRIELRRRENEKIIGDWYNHPTNADLPVSTASLPMSKTGIANLLDAYPLTWEQAYGELATHYRASWNPNDAEHTITTAQHRVANDIKELLDFHDTLTRPQQILLRQTFHKITGQVL